MLHLRLRVRSIATFVAPRAGVNNAFARILSGFARVYDERAADCARISAAHAPRARK